MMMHEVLKLLFKKPFTNKFPAKYAPKSTYGFIKLVKEGKAQIIPPVPTPPKFRGKLKYDRESCVGCGLCVKVCPAKAIELVTYKEEPKEEGARPKIVRKIRIYIGRCVYCSQCVDICPRNSLSMTDEFLLANEDKLAKELIVE